MSGHHWKCHLNKPKRSIPHHHLSHQLKFLITISHISFYSSSPSLTSASIPHHHLSHQLQFLITISHISFNSSSPSLSSASIPHHHLSHQLQFLITISHTSFNSSSPSLTSASTSPRLCSIIVEYDNIIIGELNVTLSPLDHRRRFY